MDVILFLIAIAMVLALLYPLLKRYKAHHELRAIIDKIPGPKSYPIFGTTLAYIFMPREDRFALTVEYGKRFSGGIYRMWIGSGLPELRVSRCEFIEEILKSSKHIEKSPTYNLLKPWLGEGLISSTGQHWFKHRRLITPTFHFSVLENFCDVFSENANVLVEKLNQVSAAGKSVNVYPLITKAALDIICETAMGIKCNAQLQADNDYVEAVYRFSEIAMQRFFKPWLAPDFIFERSSYAATYNKSLNCLQNFAMKVIKERKLTRQAAKGENNEISTNDASDVGMKKRQAFLDLLLDGNENENQLLTDDEIRDEVNTFMFAGHDTTSVGICWALFLIGLHDEAQEKIFSELTEIFGNDTDRVATYQDLNEMKYLERVLKESLRLYPSVPNISRKMSEDIEIGGYKIPAGAFVSLQIYFIHRDERYFEDPEKFDPDRFLPENIEERQRLGRAAAYSYVPFAAGPRNCIGQRFALLEEKSIISAIVRKFKIKSVQKREDIKLLQEIVLRPLDGIHLQFQRRQ